MRDEERIAYAQMLQDNPLLHEILEQIETAAIDACINAKPTDEATRGAYAAEVRAVRNFRRKLNLAREEATDAGSQAPA